jgi:hypothetical protein
MPAAARASAGVDRGCPGRAVPRVVGKGGERLADPGVAGVAEGDGAMLAGGFGHGRRADRGRERVRMNRNDWMPRLEQTLDQEPFRALDRDRQIAGGSQGLEAGERVVDAAFAVGEREAKCDRARVVDDTQLVTASGPVDSDEERKGRGRSLIDRPLRRHVPKVGLRPSARRERQYSRWPSCGSQAWPSPGGHRRYGRTLAAASDGKVGQ